MFAPRYFPTRYFASRYWPPSGVPVTADVEEFFLAIQQVGIFNLQLCREYDNSLQIWQAEDFEFTFDITDLTVAQIDQLHEFYLSITQEENIELIMQRWYELNLPITQVEPFTLNITQQVD